MHNCQWETPFYSSVLDPDLDSDQYLDLNNDLDPDHDHDHDNELDPDPAHRVRRMITLSRDGNNAGLVRMRLQLTLACDAFAGRLLPESKHQSSRRE